MKIRAALANDVASITALLTESGLPASDVDVALVEGFLVAENENGEIVGCIGLERFGYSALLRSLVVAPTSRSKQLSSTLLFAAESRARMQGVRELWLLTTTAAAMFRRYGYADADRVTAPREVQGSAQFQKLCPATAACMRKVM